MVLLKWTLLVLLAGYIGAVVLLYVAQRKLLYFTDPERVAPAAAGLPRAETIALETEDGERLIGWHVQPARDRPVILYFHGNGGTLALRAGRFRTLTQDGTGLVAIDYRGYGGSTGRPTQSGLMIDGRTAYGFAAARYSPDRIAVWGESLGTGVAVALAAERSFGRIVLEAPFTSAADAAARHYPFVPVRALMKDQFRSDEVIGSIRAPLLVLHGTDDDVVPIDLGERLFALAPEPKRFVPFPGGGHDNLEQFGALDVGLRFLSEPL
jgi:fermentation-respiration switch protein FrsA (DUF1100 family)